MSDKNKFDPKKLSFVEFRMIKGQVDTPDDFIVEKVRGHSYENKLELFFDIQKKLIKSDFIVRIKTDSKKNNPKEATGLFHLVFIFHIQNMEQLTKLNKNNHIDINPWLGNAISSVAYSTSRGILLTRLQGTALQNFVLPIIDPNTLLENNKKE